MVFYLIRLIQLSKLLLYSEYYFVDCQKVSYVSDYSTSKCLELHIFVMVANWVLLLLSDVRMSPAPVVFSQTFLQIITATVIWNIG